MRRIAAVTLLAASGCTIISGLGDLEAVKDGTDGTLTDGGVRVDGEVVIPGTDATAQNETGAPIEDGVAPVFDAPPGSNFCDRVAASVEVCLDYDSKGIGASELVHQNSTLQADGPGHDSPNALHCVGVDEAPVQCFHVVALPPNPTKVHLTFDVQVEEIGDLFEVNDIEFSYQTGRCALQPTIDENEVFLNEYCPDQGDPDQVNHLIATLDNGVGSSWYTFDITLDFGTKTVSGSFNGTVLSPITLDDRFHTSKSVVLHAGMSFAPKNTPASKVRTDNITVDTE